MKTTSLPYRTRSAGSSFGKFVATLSSLITIAVLLFAGTRNWKSGKSLLATLTDVSDIRYVIAKVENTAVSKSVKAAAIEPASESIEHSLLDQGKLLRRPAGDAGHPPVPAGVHRDVVTR